MNIYGIIYKATNTDNNKVYIGQTTKTLKIRIKKHMEKIITFFHSALHKKNGVNFIWEIIDYANSFGELNEKEIKWIAYYNSTNREYGYNCTEGGYNGRPVESVRKKLSSGQMGEKNHAWKGGKREYSCVICNGIIFDYSPRKYCSRDCTIIAQSGTGNSFYGKKHTKEAIDKISIANTGKKRTQEYKNTCRLRIKENGSPLLGRKHTLETRKKMSVAATTRLAKKENHPMYGKRHTAESIEKNRQSNIKTAALKKRDCIFKGGINE